MDTHTPPSSEQSSESKDTAPLLSWSAPIHPVHERSPRWYMKGALVILLCTVYGIFSGAWTFSLVMLLTGGVYFLLRSAPPSIGQMELSKQGFSLNGEFTSWEDAKDFWLVQTPAYTELHIAKKRGWSRENVIQIGQIAVSEIRASVSQFLPERSDQQERLMDTIIRICKL